MKNEDDILWLKDVSAEQMRRTVDALHRVHHLIYLITDLDTLLERIMEESKQVALAEACSLMLYDSDADELYFHVALGESGDQQALKREVRLKLNQGIAGVAAATRQSINVEDVRQDERFYETADETSHFETRSLLAVPLVDRENLIGVVEVLNKSGGGAFSDADLHLLEMFSSLAATSIANARLIEENLRAERMAAIGQAVAGLSHYTKNLITAMQGSVDLIETALNLNKLEIVKKTWPILGRCTKRISCLVQDMLAYSGPRTPDRKPCDLKEVFDEVEEMFWSLLVQKDVELEITADGVTGPVCVDREGLFRCLLNLLTNAADAAPPENGKVRVFARTTPDGDLLIVVEDNGPGVPEESVRRIFDPFYSTKGSHGTGLGLAVSHKIVREHGGDITVGQGSDGGARFEIVIPKSREKK